jgi:hypothetical protein
VSTCIVVVLPLAESFHFEEKNVESVVLVMQILHHRLLARLFICTEE